MLQCNDLEVSAGKVRNIPYYNAQQVTSIVMTDTSRDMLWHAIQKHHKQAPQLKATFCLADAQHMLSEHGQFHDTPYHANQRNEAKDDSSALWQKLETFEPAQFDTVIDTFGLCSHADPEAALRVSLYCSLSQN